MQRLKDGFRGVGLIALFVATGCGAGMGGDESKSNGVANSQTEPLSTKQVLCSALDNFHVAVPAVSTNCTLKQTKNLYYNGSLSPTGGLADLASRPFVTSAAYYCAVKDSHGAKNSAGVVSTSFGGFGMSTRLQITRNEPTPTMVVEGQRIGGITLFGASADLDVQEFQLLFPSEMRPAGQITAVHTGTGQTYFQNVTKQQGLYMQALSDSAEWGIGGRVPIPTPIPGLTIGITPSLQHDSAKLGSTPLFDSLNNNLVSSTVTNTTQLNAPNPAYKYDTLFAAQQNCLKSCVPGILCVCQPYPTSKEVLEHERTCSGGTCNYGNTTDGILPYDGPFGGATQTMLYHDNLLNWLHFGHPGAGGIAGEPKYDLTKDGKGQTSAFGLTIDAKYDIGVASVSVGVNTTVGLRSGFAIRQNRVPGAGGEFNTDGQVQTALDSQSSVGINASVSVELPIFGSFSQSFTLLKPTGTSGAKETVASSVRYADDDATSRFLSYTTTVTGAKDPNTAFTQCLQSAPAATPVKPADPAPFLTNVGNAAIKQIHPCRVTTCNAQNVVQQCDWNVSTNSFTCQSLGMTCSDCFRYSASLCDETNTVLTNPDTNMPVTLVRPTPGSCIH